MNSLYSFVTCAALLSMNPAVAHVSHDHSIVNQIPLGYVKYPYQATYPGDNEGE